MENARSWKTSWMEVLILRWRWVFTTGLLSALGNKSTPGTPLLCEIKYAPFMGEWYTPLTPHHQRIFTLCTAVVQIREVNLGVKYRPQNAHLEFINIIKTGGLHMSLLSNAKSCANEAKPNWLCRPIYLANCDLQPFTVRHVVLTYPKLWLFKYHTEQMLSFLMK